VSSCPSNHFLLDEKECLPCQADCEKCLNQTACVKCKFGFTKDYAKRCVPAFACEKGYYFELNTGTCEKCDSHCRSCDGPEPYHCLECSAQKALYDGRCQLCKDLPADANVTFDPSERVCRGVCGDGFRRGYGEECDDGNNIDGDGCSHDCKVERGFRCEGINPDVCEVVAPPEAYLEYDPSDYRIIKIKFTRKVIADNICDVSLLFDGLLTDFVYGILPSPDNMTCTIRIEILKDQEYDRLLISFNNPDEMQDQFGIPLALKSRDLIATFPGFLIRDQNFRYYSDAWRLFFSSLLILSLIMGFVIVRSPYAYSFWRFIDYIQFLNMLQFSGVSFPDNIKNILEELNLFNLYTDPKIWIYSPYSVLWSSIYLIIGFFLIELISFLYKNIGGMLILNTKKLNTERHFVVTQLKLSLSLLGIYNLSRFLYYCFLSSYPLEDYTEKLITFGAALLLSTTIFKTFTIEGINSVAFRSPGQYYWSEVDLTRKKPVSLAIMEFFKRVLVTLILLSTTLKISTKFVFIMVLEILIGLLTYLIKPFVRKGSTRMNVIKCILTAWLCWKLYTYSRSTVDDRIIESWTLIQTIIGIMLILLFDMAWDMVLKLTVRRKDEDKHAHCHSPTHSHGEKKKLKKSPETELKVTKKQKSEGNEDEEEEEEGKDSEESPFRRRQVVY